MFAPPVFRWFIAAGFMIVNLQVICADEREEFFERKIRPILVGKCVGCHGPGKQESDIRLDSREQVLSGTADVEPLVDTKDVSASRLLQVILYSDDDTQMPPKQKLSDADIQAVRKWIADGAVWPKDHDFGGAGAVDVDAWKQHWAFQPTTDPPRPPIGNSNWHPIDSFVRFKLDAIGVASSPLASGRTLVRRISFAVTGLPPKLSDLEAVANLNEDSDAQQFLTDYTDRLLASPQFGERWARYWLDISRYADTKGYVFQEDREYPEAWKYRDWVIQSLNDDMSYDEFLKRQIAGDKMPGAEDPNQLAAMGFFTLGRRFLNNVHDIIDDRIDVLTRGTMALTVTCARCHDHKFDPIPTADYYSLYGVFNSSDEPKNEPSTLRLVDRAKPREPRVFVRGSAGNRGEQVTRHFLTALSKEQPPAAFTDGSGRLELANKIASPDNPLTARVAVNRIWIRLFGKGLVDSPSDFGVRTGPPSHPALLDHLATYFIRNQWSRKSLIRYILLSHTWRQSSASRPEIEDQDPENRLLARMPRRRLNFEAFRDSLLSISGELDPTVGGESDDIEEKPYSFRRTLYARIDRQNLPNIFRTFDFASPDNHSAQRFETTVPQQALFQFNNDFVFTIAESIAASSEAGREGDAGDLDSANTVAQVFKMTLQRSPTENELVWAVDFLENSQSLAPPGDGTVGWLYGWGELDEKLEQLVRFTPLPVFHKDRWGGGVKLPDSKLGWCSLTRDGGHPGGIRQQCAIRRWVADRDSEIRITGIVEHDAAQGDGVQCSVLYDGKRMGQVHVHHQKKPLATKLISVAAGQPVDFVTYCGANESHDSFRWRIKIQQTVAGQDVKTWRSEKEFSGDAAQKRLGPVQQLAQALLLTNEFMFVD